MSETLALETREVSVTPAPHVASEPAAGAFAATLVRLLEASLIWIVLLGGWFLAAEYAPLGDNPLIPHPLVTARARRLRAKTNNPARISCPGRRAAFRSPEARNAPAV